MARMKFLCDADRCIECNACVTACKNEHEVPWGINRRRVVTINDGSPVNGPSPWPVCTVRMPHARRCAR
jgi:Fe-S-cluster-containing dehydrogenase component